jgi:hypothetical protein
VKRKNGSLLVIATWLSLATAAPGAQGPPPEEVSPRIARFETWLESVEQHRPGDLDEGVRLISTWNQEQLRLIWMDALTIVSLVREPSVSLFYVTEPGGVGGAGQQGRQLSSLATTRSRQVLYTVGELRRLREIAKQVSPKGTPGPENNVLKRGAMLHADIEVLVPIRSGASANSARPGPGGTTLHMDDGQQLGLTSEVSHWDMGRRLLDAVRPPESKSSLKMRPDPGADDLVRRWYLAGSAYMLRMRLIDITQFSRARELFPNDPDVSFFVASLHEYLAGVRTQSVMRLMRARRDVRFDVQEEDAELRLAEQFYKRALERNPKLIEARIRLGRVLGLRERHEEAVAQLRQAQTVEEPLLQFYLHLFLGREFEALGNGPEARQSYERAVELVPTAQSPLLGLSRVADEAGDRTAAREAVARVLKLPIPDEERADPWWVYEVVPARGADGLLADLRERIAALPK